MRVLVACEVSGVVRDAFAAVGCDAWSCDTMETERPGQHIKTNVLFALDKPWDLMIAFPPCTHLAVSGARWWHNKRDLQYEAIRFARLLLEAPIHRIAMENPVGILSSKIRKPDQIIQPWQFGEDASKTTCLWLKGLPALVPTKVLPKPKRGHWANQTKSGQNKLGPDWQRARTRARTYDGIARAMAEQWGGA